jgi:hypothetical protein
MKRTVSVVLAFALAVGFVSMVSAANRSEETRLALYDLMNRFQATGRADVAIHAERVRKALDVMTPAQLDVLARAYGDALIVRASSTANAGVLVPRVDPVYSAECGSTRTDAATLQAQLDTWQDMEAAAAVAQGECDAAADPATACPPAATAHDAALTALFAYQNSLLCNADIDSAEINATLQTVNGLEESVPSMDDIQAALDALEADILDALATHDADIKTAIAALAAGQEEIKDQLEEIKQLLLTPQGRRPGWNGRPGSNDQGGNDNGNGNGH